MNIDVQALAIELSKKELQNDLVDLPFTAYNEIVDDTDIYYLQPWAQELLEGKIEGFTRIIERFYIDSCEENSNNPLQ